MNSDLALYAIMELCRHRHLSEIALMIDNLTEEYELIKQELSEDDQGIDILFLEYTEILDLLLKELDRRKAELQEQYIIKEDFGV